VGEEKKKGDYGEGDTHKGEGEEGQRGTAKKDERRTAERNVVTQHDNWIFSGGTTHGKRRLSRKKREKMGLSGKPDRVGFFRFGRPKKKGARGSQKKKWGCGGFCHKKGVPAHETQGDVPFLRSM